MCDLLSDRAREEALRNTLLGYLTPSNKELIKSHKVMELEYNNAKKRPDNHSPTEMYRIFCKRNKQRMDMKA